MNAPMESNNSKHHAELEKVEMYTNETLAQIARHFDETDEFPSEPVNYFFQNNYFRWLTSGSIQDRLAFLEMIRIVSTKFASLASILLTQGFYAVVPIHQFGTEEQKKKYIDGLISGKIYGGFGLSEENGGGDYSYIQTKAWETEDGWEINGGKQYVSNAPIADLLLIVANTNKLDGTEGIGIFIVDAANEGVEISEPIDKMGIKSLPVAAVTLDGAIVTKDALLGNQIAGEQQIEYTMNLMKLSVAMQAIGISQGTFEKGLDYMSVVRKFGNRLIDNQSTQQKMADLKTMLYSTEAFVRKIVQEKSQNTVEVAMAKLLTANVAIEITENVIQLTGGYGYMKESEIERYLRDAKVTAIYGGSSNSQRRIITQPLISAHPAEEDKPPESDEGR